MDWFDIIIVVLFMSFPLMGVLVDKVLHNASKNGEAPVTTPPPVQHKEEPVKRRFSRSFDTPEEGQHAFKQNTESTLYPERKKAEPIDKKKLIIYSEIMKPKFDE